MARYICTGVLRDENGGIISGATVNVYKAGGVIAADVYAADAGGVAVNSVTSAADGRFTFYADDSTYEYSQEFKIVATKAGYTTITVDDIKIYGISAPVAAIAKVTPAANKLPYFTSGTAADVCDLTAAARTILDDATVGDILTTIGGPTLTALAALTLTQGGLFTATGADAPAILAKGLANLKLFMNAGATAPEWASGIKVGTFTRDGSIDSGDANVTGVGFLPSAVIIIGGYSSASSATIGFDNATTHVSIYNNHYAAATTWALTASYCGYLYEDTGKGLGLLVKAMIADGFTITYTKVGAATATATFGYLALR